MEENNSKLVMDHMENFNTRQLKALGATTPNLFNRTPPLVELQQS
jgi:hypothetical protein